MLKGVAFEKIPFGKHIIVSNIEHPAVKESALWLQSQGFEIDFAPVDKAGFVDVDELAELIRPDTTLVSIMAVNNEIGSIQPIQKISELLADRPTISFHVDAVQAVAKIPIAAYLTDRVDFATFSSHKFHGVRGVGFVYIKSGKENQSAFDWWRSRIGQAINDGEFSWHCSDSQGSATVYGKARNICSANGSDEEDSP